MVGVVLGLHRLFFAFKKEKGLCKRKFVVKKVNIYDMITKIRLYR